MGFEILPILPSDFHNDEPLYDVFEITGAAKWTPSQFCLSPPMLLGQIPTPCNNDSTTLQVATNNDTKFYFYDPSDAVLSFPYENASIVFDSEAYAVDCFLASLSLEKLAGKYTINLASYGYKENTADQATS
jgi:hypothetical protein